MPTELDILEESAPSEYDTSALSVDIVTSPCINIVHERQVIESNLLESSNAESLHANKSSCNNEETPAKKPKVDLRIKSIERYESLFPDFYFSSSQNGWFCKICSSFAVGTGQRHFIEQAGQFADHPSERANDHLKTIRHQTAVKNKQAFDELAKRDSNVWKMLRESSLTKESQRLTQARYIIKSFFRITHLLIMKNWAHTHNFKDLVELVALCGSKDVYTHLLLSPGNATYMSPDFIAKYINIIYDHVRLPLLTSLRKGKYAFFTDETSDITSIEQMAVYATFEHGGAVKEHFIGLLPLSKLVGTSLSAPNVFKVIENFFVSINVPLRNARYACMDTTRVNSGNKGGLKAYLEHAVPQLFWIGCTNHKLALCFKHILSDFPSVLEADVFLLNLWKFFKYRTLAMHLLQECAEIYGDLGTIVPVCPSTTRWTAHERACLAVYKSYQHFLQALATCYNERKEGEALGLFIQATSSEMIATILMLLDVFSAISPLTFSLQSSQSSICLSDIPTYVEKTVRQLDNILTNTERQYFNTTNFTRLQAFAEEISLSLPATSRLRKKPFSFTSYDNEVYKLFVAEFKRELLEAFEQMKFWQCLSIFDPRNLPKNLVDLANYGGEELSRLLERYGECQESTKFGNTTRQERDVDPVITRAEFEGFEFLMYTKRKHWQDRIDINITKCNSDADRELLVKQHHSFNARELWSALQKDDCVSSLYPNCIYLFKLLMIFPLSAACVERLFSKLKLVKNRLRNQLSQTTLERLLMIGTESPKDGFDDAVLESFVDELKHRNPKMRIKL